MVSSKWAKPPGSLGTRTAKAPLVTLARKPASSSTFAAALGRIAEDAHDAEVAHVGDEKVMHVNIRIGKRATQARQAALLVLDENGELFVVIVLPR